MGVGVGVVVVVVVVVVLVVLVPSSGSYCSTSSPTIVPAPVLRFVICIISCCVVSDVPFALGLYEFVGFS